MKQRHMLSLLQTGFTTVNVILPMSKHQQDVPQARQPMPWEAPIPQQYRPPSTKEEDKLYVYKSSDSNIKAGDRVLVERLNTPSGLAIGIVHSVDPAPKIDVDAEFDYRWIVQRVDMEAYAAVQRAEQQFEAHMQEVEREHQREKLLAKMAEHLPQGGAARALFDNAVQSFGAAFGAQATITMQPAAAPAVHPGAPYAAPAAEQAVAGVQCK